MADDLVAPSDATDLAPHQLTLGRELGRGTYGVVYAAEYAGAPVAVKVLIGGDGSGADFAHEVAMLRALKHPDLVLFMGVVQLSAGRGLVQELVRGGTLRAALTHGRLGGWPERLSVALDLATGVAFMHAQQVLHRDLKAENVLLEPLTPSPSLGGGGGGGSLQAQLLLGAPRPTPVRAKIADLGISRLASPGAMAQVGSAWWRAPEVASGHYGPGADLFALGMTLLELITGREGEDLRLAATQEHKMTFHHRPALLWSDEELGPLLGAAPPALVRLALALVSEEPSLRPPSEQVQRLLKAQLGAWAQGEARVQAALNQVMGPGGDLGVRLWLSMPDVARGDTEVAPLEAGGVRLGALLDVLDEVLARETGRGLDLEGRAAFPPLLLLEGEDTLLDLPHYVRWFALASELRALLRHPKVVSFWRVGFVSLLDGTRAAAKLIQAGKEGECIVRVGSRPQTLVIEAYHNGRPQKLLVSVGRDHVARGDASFPSLAALFAAPDLAALKWLHPSRPLAPFLALALAPLGGGDEGAGYSQDLEPPEPVEQRQAREGVREAMRGALSPRR